MRERLAAGVKGSLCSGNCRKALGLTAMLVLLSLWVVAVASAKDRPWRDESFLLVWAGSGSYSYDSFLHQLNCTQDLRGAGDYNFRDTWRFEAKLRPGTKKSGPEFKIDGLPSLEGGPFGDFKNRTHITGTVTRTEDAESCFGLIRPQPGGKVDCASDKFRALAPAPGQEEGADPRILGPLDIIINHKDESALFKARAWEGETGTYTGNDPHKNGCKYWDSQGFTPGAATILGAELTFAGLPLDFSEIVRTPAPRKRNGQEPVPRPVRSAQYDHNTAGGHCLPYNDTDRHDSCRVSKNDFSGTIELFRTK
jgi:hypothetical protein